MASTLKRKVDTLSTESEEDAGVNAPSHQSESAISTNFDVVAPDETQPEAAPSDDGIEEKQYPLSDEPKGEDEQQPRPSKFQFKQRVYAKDTETGMFYEGIVRRVMYGVQHQRQIKLNSHTSQEEISAFLEAEPQPTWWYFIHYNGWNVKWDRWVEENHLYEPTESTKAFSKRLHVEVLKIKAELRKKHAGKPGGVHVAMELERRMIQMEREHRMEERRRELAERGEVMEENEEVLEETKPRNKWTKGNIKREISLRERHLQGRRSQTSSELLVLPFALKKIMVEEWEIITQCDMLAALPAAVPIREALNRYRESKLGVKHDKKPDEDKEQASAHSSHSLLQTIGEKEQAKETEKEQASSPTSPSPVVATPSFLQPIGEKEQAKETEQEREYREMVDGVCLFFDQALAERLLYEPETVQYETLQADATKRSSDIYGCEFLLRLFIRLPALLVGELTEKESKSILARLNDLVRFLQKHQTTLFSQSYRRLNEEELQRKAELEEM